MAKLEPARFVVLETERAQERVAADIRAAVSRRLMGGPDAH